MNMRPSGGEHLPTHTPTGLDGSIEQTLLDPKVAAELKAMAPSAMEVEDAIVEARDRATAPKHSEVEPTSEPLTPETIELTAEDFLIEPSDEIRFTHGPENGKVYRVSAVKEGNKGKSSVSLIEMTTGTPDTKKMPLALLQKMIEKGTVMMDPKADTSNASETSQLASVAADQKEIETLQATIQGDAEPTSPVTYADTESPSAQVEASLSSNEFDITTRAFFDAGDAGEAPFDVTDDQLRIRDRFRPSLTVAADFATDITQNKSKRINLGGSVDTENTAKENLWLQLAAEKAELSKFAVRNPGKFSFMRPKVKAKFDARTPRIFTNSQEGLILNNPEELKSALLRSGDPASADAVDTYVQSVVELGQMLQSKEV